MKKLILIFEKEILTHIIKNIDFLCNICAGFVLKRMRYLLIKKVKANIQTK